MPDELTAPTEVLVRRLADVDPAEPFPGVVQRIVHDQPGIQMKTFTMTAGEFATEAHSHPEIQIMLVTSGEFHMEVGGQHVHLVEGTVLTIPGDVPHRSWSTGTHAAGIDVFYLPRDDA